jgi:RNA polymerase sigma-70 factor (ECF subfamily)
VVTADRGASDAGLVASLAKGDASALAQLYDRYADAIYRAAFRRLGDRQLAEEVLQDTYLALWNRAELYDPAAGSLLAWLSTIARNRAVDRLRAAGRRPHALPLSAMVDDDEVDDRGVDRALGQGDLVGSGSTETDPEVLADRLALRQELRDALAAIPTTERQVLELAYYGDLTQSEIATRLGWPLGTVKTRTRRALLRLRAGLATSLGPDVALTPEDAAELDGGAKDGAAGAAVARSSESPSSDAGDAPAVVVEVEEPADAAR